MKHPMLPVIFGLTVSLLAGCSKQTPTLPGPKSSNLGVVLMTDGLPTYRDLGEGKACVITPTITSNGIRLAFVIQQTNSIGQIQTLATPTAELTDKDRTVEVRVGDVDIYVTPDVKQPKADDKAVILPGRSMSENEVAEIASGKLPEDSQFQCEFKDGVWKILEVEKNVWGISSRTTTVDGTVVVQSTNAMRLVLLIRDNDGKIEQTF